LKKYVELLKENQLKITPQRLEIMKFLDEHKTHPTADEIYSELKENNPSLSKTTVYNALEVLKKHNLIQILTISGHESRYEFRHTMHHHFLCKKCNEITDIEIECPNIGKTIDMGYKIDEVHGYFKGVCYKCQKMEEDQHKSKNTT